MKYQSNLTQEQALDKNDLQTNNLKTLIENNETDIFQFQGQSIAIHDDIYKVFVSYNSTYIHEDNEPIGKCTSDIAIFALNTETKLFHIYASTIESDTLYLNEDKLLSIYQQYKKELLNVTIVSSLKALESNHIKSMFLYSSVMYQDYLLTLYHLFPFIRNEDYVCKHKSFLTVLTDVFYPISRLTIEDSRFIFDLLDKGEDFNRKLLQETSEYKRIKQIIPNLNKKSYALIKKILKGENSILCLPDVDYYASIECFNLDILTIFKTTEKLNEFLEAIHSDAVNEYDFYIYLSSPSNLYFYQNILPKFFSGQGKFENECIRFLNKENKNTEETAVGEIYNFIKSVDQYHVEICKAYNAETEEEHDEICNCTDYVSEYHWDNMPTYQGSYPLFLEYIEDIKRMYDKLVEILNETKNDKDKQYIELLFTRKFDNIEELHDELAYAVNIINDKRAEFEKNSLVHQELMKNNVILKPVLNNVLLKEIGLKMYHCVGSYEKSILDKCCSIYYIQDTITKDFIGCLEYRHNTNAIVQAKAKYNRRINDDNTLFLIKEFSKLNDVEIKTHDLF